MASSFSIGGVEVKRDGDRVEFAVRGPLTLADAAPLHDFLGQVGRETGHCFVLADVSQMGAVPPETRRHIGEWHKTNSISGIALYGGGFATRALVTLMFNAVRLVGGNNIMAMEFARDEQAARRWLDAHRQKVLGSTAGGRRGDA